MVLETLEDSNWMEYYFREHRWPGIYNPRLQVDDESSYGVKGVAAENHTTHLRALQRFHGYDLEYDTKTTSQEVIT